MTSNLLLDKGFRKQPDTVAEAARIFISKLRQHIERDDCAHCREVLASEVIDT